MKIRLISNNCSFGVKLAPDFAEKIAQNCVDVPLLEAKKIAAKLMQIKPDNLNLLNVSTQLKKQDFFGPRYRHIKIEYETQKPDNTTVNHLFGDCEQSKIPYSAKEIFDIILRLVKKNQ